ncbi:hypothetical protein IAT38_005939 [Cryptococcus sp. DSM 104549]
MSLPIPTITVAGKTVGRMGYGLMQLTTVPTPLPREQQFEAMKAAADSGATCWSSGAYYGRPGNNFLNIELIDAFFERYPEYKDKIVLVIKGGINYTTFAPGGSLDFLRNEINQIKKILGDKEIDVFSLGRLPDAPIEEVFKSLVNLQKEGLFNAIGVSEMGPASLQIASKITPIAVNEIEVSLFCYEPEIRDTVKWCTANRIPIFAYSPLGRGMLTRKYKTPEDIPEGDLKRMFPRFQGEAFYENLKLADRLDDVAAKRGVKTSQLALAWVLGQSDMTIPIPGSSKADRVRDNAEATRITLSAEEYEQINKILDSFEVKGDRYPATGMAHLDYDEVLLGAPWVPKQDGEGKTRLFKFAKHPDRTGYIFLTTDLATVSYEILIGSALSSRLTSSAKLIPASQRQDEEGELMDRVESAVQRIGEVMEDLAEAEMGVREDRNYDRVATLKTTNFAWIFNLTDLRGSKPLSVISRHLLSPLSSLIAQDRSISVSERDPTQKALEVISSREVMRGMRRVGVRAQGDGMEVDRVEREAGKKKEKASPSRDPSPIPWERPPSPSAPSPPRTRQAPPSPTPPPANSATPPAPIDEPSNSATPSASPETQASNTDEGGSQPVKKKKKTKEEKEAEEAEEEELVMKRQEALRKAMMKGQKKGGRNRLGL